MCLCEMELQQAGVGRDDGVNPSQAEALLWRAVLAHRLAVLLHGLACCHAEFRNVLGKKPVNE